MIKIIGDTKRQEKLPLSALRRQALAKLHIAKKDLALCEDSYRGLVLRVTGHESAGACSDAQIHKVLLEFRRLGWKPRAVKGARKISEKAKVRMIYGIWGDLRVLLDEADDATLRAFVRKQTKGPAHPDGVDAPEFLSSAQADKVIGGLQGWLAGVRATQAAGSSV